MDAGNRLLSAATLKQPGAFHGTLFGIALVSTSHRTLKHAFGQKDYLEDYYRPIALLADHADVNKAVRLDDFAKVCVTNATRSLSVTATHCALEAACVTYLPAHTTGKLIKSLFRSACRKACRLGDPTLVAERMVITGARVALLPALAAFLVDEVCLLVSATDRTTMVQGTLWLGFRTIRSVLGAAAGAYLGAKLSCDELNATEELWTLGYAIAMADIVLFHALVPNARDGRSFYFRAKEMVALLSPRLADWLPQASYFLSTYC